MLHVKFTDFFYSVCRLRYIKNREKKSRCCAPSSLASEDSLMCLVDRPTFGIQVIACGAKDADPRRVANVALLFLRHRFYRRSSIGLLTWYTICQHSPCLSLFLSFALPRSFNSPVPWRNHHWSGSHCPERVMPSFPSRLPTSDKQTL